MSFADNLKQVRKEKGLSQEELAELLEVSRQAVSKWEQGAGYPETEKLLLLSNRLNVSLDILMGTEPDAENRVGNADATGTIVITSPHENVIVNCCRVIASQKMRTGKGSPKYALFGASSKEGSFWGEPTTFLSWYADEQQIAEEISEISDAIVKGLPTYELKYSVKVKRHWLSVKMVKD